MGKYNFDNLYKNATMLDQDFLRNEFGFDLENVNDTIIYKNYYTNIIGVIDELNVFKPTSEEVELYLKNGRIARMWASSCLIETEEERKYLFLMAQARQLKYDKDNGRTSMIKGEDEKYKICDDTKAILRQLGLLKSVRY